MSVSPKIISKKRPFNGFESSVIEELAKSARLTSYMKGQEIFSRGQNDDYEIFLVMGAIELVTSDNRSVIIDTSERKAEYAISSMKPRQYTARAAKHDTCICWIHEKILKHVLKKHNLSLHSSPDSDMVPVNSFRNALPSGQYS